MHLDIQLTLRWNLVEATATSITLNVNDTKTVTGILTDTLEALEQTALNTSLVILSLSLQDFLLLASLLHNLVKLTTLVLKGSLTVVELLLSTHHIALTLLNLLHSLLDLLLAELNLQFLELNLLCKSIILAVVLYLVKLTVVTLNTCLSLLNVGTALHDSLLIVVDVTLNLVQTNIKTFYLILKVLNLKRKFTTKSTLLVNLRKSKLQLIESFELILYCQICRIFSCHKFNDII